MIRLAITLCLMFGLGAGAAAQDEAAKAELEDPGASISAGGPEYRLSLDQRESRLNIAFYGQMSSFKRDNISLVGYAFEALFSYAAMKRIAVQVSMNQALSMANSVTVLYTGIRSSAAYAIQGEFIKLSSVLQVNERPTIAVKTGEKPLMAIDGGVDQFFFNGISRIVPATGISLGFRYDRTVFGLRASAMMRYGLLVISEAQVPMLSAGVGFTFAF